MTEYEPVPQDSSDLDILLKKVVLAEALVAFSTKVLADDMLFRAISATLKDGESATKAETDLQTDFSVTPNVKDGKYSLWLEESASGYASEVEANNGAVGDMFFKFATVKHVPICVIETGDNCKKGIVADRSFVELALGRDVGVEKPNQDEIVAIEAAVRTVLGGINEVVGYCAQRGVEVLADEFGRPQLVEELRNTSYISE